VQTAAFWHVGCPMGDTCVNVYTSTAVPPEATVPTASQARPPEPSTRQLATLKDDTCWHAHTVQLPINGVDIEELPTRSATA
jgi:hypothetical protein